MFGHRAPNLETIMFSQSIADAPFSTPTGPAQAGAQAARNRAGAGASTGDFHDIDLSGDLA